GCIGAANYLKQMARRGYVAPPGPYFSLSLYFFLTVTLSPADVRVVLTTSLDLAAFLIAFRCFFVSFFSLITPNSPAARLRFWVPSWILRFFAAALAPSAVPIRMSVFLAATVHGASQPPIAKSLRPFLPI